MMPWRNTQRGFTLLEILVAAFILAVGFLGIVGVTTSMMHARAHSSHVTTATFLAQERLEEMRGLGYDRLPVTTNQTVEDYHTMLRFPLFKRVVSVDRIGVEAGLKKVTVTVYWDRDKHQVVLKTLVGP
jgi:type IV pilus assembly protein PilV